MNDIIYITGHKNPDTDSICSAIAYAELKKRHAAHAVPIRIGDINKETEFVLKYFGVEVPEYRETVRTQISDLDIDIISPVSEDISIKAAWSIMVKNNVKVLPVADVKGKLTGIITLSDITGSYLDALENNILSASGTPYRNIMDTLAAKLVCGNEEEFKSAGKVVIAAMAPEDMTPFVDKGDIVLVGSRKDSQLKAIEIGASSLIITCGATADEEVIQYAEEKGCIVMDTYYDTFTTARLINQSIPVSHIMTKEQLISFNINDYIDNIKDKMLKTRYRSYPVVDDNGIIKGFISRYHLITQRRKKVILLDHNERAQTIDGIDQADILEIIDHHRIGDIQTGYPIFFKNDAVGSTSTLIANMYFENGMNPSKSVAGLLCAAIISDTMKFKSPTSTYADELAASRLAKIADINIDEFATSLFKANASLQGMTPQTILDYDFKDFVFNKYKIGIGQINSSDAEGLHKIKDELLKHMRTVLENKGYNLILLLITNIIKEGSELLFVGDDHAALMEKAFNIKTGESSAFLKGVVSRKKQVVPQISSTIQRESI
ncbi:Inorganic diphosphatase [Ruminiclostridium papyrosolvens DSM 2782]|uniref:inorganic diphosphatase n=1 Tax=Ruminiclostridium papyrosolvens DSM 2782 TaxID=588581 RepID=F1TE80_9FIRM|nr:putative manganese-dependent inorganic diphosphatase [Ruminiclostridium papyrosolvens]EGD47320.1 Inorganic diphosphatase [Ruminiclostridium papyrosolvens DSM 2782]WES34667.1 putative manganese-dependent inorganic diphosphatase [Ruminiclostridium papyrosolvens DSM 2782]